MLIVRNQEHSGHLLLQGENSGGTITDLFEGDPDGAATLYYAGTGKAATSSAGITVGDGATSNTTVDILGNSSGTSGGQVLLRGSGTDLDAAIDNDSGNLRFLVNDFTENGIIIAPNGSVTLYYSNTSEFNPQGS